VPVESFSVTPRYRSVKYTGSGGDDICGSFCGSWTKVSESGGQLHVSFFGGTATVNTGDWVIREPSNLCQIYTSEPQYLYDYIEIVDPDDLALATMPVISMGIAAVPTLLGATQTNVNVTIRPTLPAVTGYSVASVVVGGVNLLAALSILSTTIINASTVQVTVRNTGLLSLGGATVLVAAVDDT
jgi:hypothetical protein